MKKQAIILALLFMAFLLFQFIPIGEKGLYNTWSGVILCHNHNECAHEVAHKIDHEGGWVSHTREFALAVEVFVWSEFSREIPHPFAPKIITLPGVFKWNGWFSDPQAELYASLFEWSEGKEENMPENFRRFYDWKRATELMKKYER